MNLLLVAAVALLASCCSAQVLTPSYFNLAAKKKIEATSTCGVGVSGPELFCKLTGANPDKGDEVTGFEVIHGQLCDHCDPNHPNKTHKPEYAVDGTELWWQSPPLSRGLEFNEVNLTIDLGQEFHVAYILIKMANSPRPGVFALERSKDFGLTWKPWQFFADTPSDCRSYFGNTNYDTSITRDDSVICTTEYSKVVPLEGGEIVVSLVNNRPSAQNFSYSAALQDWTKATNIRLRLLRTKTLLGHLMAVARQDPTITRRYFYSIRDISIGGQCVCNGHARNCNLTDPRRPEKIICNCEHNTCGDQCDKCCPGFIQKPWRPATLDMVNECEACQCHGHSYECDYDEQVAKDRLSMDIHGKMEGGGVCKNCQHNTEGINCEKCKFGYYRPYGVPLDAPNGCRRCNCDSTFSSGGCDEGSGLCQCKPEFAGVDCKRCNVGYYDYPYCKPCRCNVNGTERQQCDPGYGQCPCKPNFDGPTCDQCAMGYFGFPECKPCDCDDYGSQEKRCDRRSGQCICKPRFGGRTCGQCANGYFNYPRCESCNCDQAGTLEEVCDKNNGVCLCKENFAGTRCEKCLAGHFRFPHCISCNCNEHGVQVNDCNLDGQCFCKPNFMGRTCDQCSPGYYRYPDCIPCNCNPQGSRGPECDQVTGQCHCSQTFEGFQCDSCKANYYNFPLCEECNCHQAGAREIPGFPLGGCGSHSGGKLCECKDKVTGKYCDTCKPNYWNLNVYSPEGCEDCGCDVRGTIGGSRYCDPGTGQCLCKPYVTGKRCDQCQDGTFNLQEHNVFGCQPCKCVVGGSQNMFCDKTSGQCNCKPRITGKNCESPIMTHYYPDLHHNKYEIEEGRTPGGGLVRYGFNEGVFPGFSWKGYAIFSELQEEVLVDVDVKKEGFYKILYRYQNPGKTRINAEVAVTPDRNVYGGQQQTSSVQFHPQRSNMSVVSSEGGAHKVFMLKPGRWSVSLKTPENVYVDYLVLLPSEYYEATVLKDKTIGPCTVPPTPAPCKHYVYLNLVGYSETDATHGHDGWSKRPTQVYEDRNVLNQLNKTDLAYLNHDQNILILNVTVPRPDKYIFLVTYFTPDLKRTQEVEVDVMTSSGRSTGYLKLLNCPHSSLCRQYVADGSHDVQVFQVDGHYATLTFTGRSDIELAIDAVYAIPASVAHELQLSFIDPKFKCVYQDSKCIDTFTSGKIPGMKVDFSVSGEVVSAKPKAEVRVRVEPGKKVFVPHYYQPTSPAFDVDVVVEVDDRRYNGVFKADHCPNIHGCPGIVRFEGGAETVDLNNPDIRITFSSSKDIWLDYVTIVPHIHYNDNTLKEHEEVDDSSKFINKCGVMTSPADQRTKELCKEGIYSVVTDFNEGALKCDCSPEGSTSFTCDPFGGQCNCRAHVIGRTCTHCETGYWGFPDCRECQCPSRTCDPQNGRCICPPRVTGARCDSCLPRTFGFDAVVGCEDCDCDPRGVRDNDMDCDQVNGQCRCKPNVSGRKCDKCSIGHYGFPFCNECSCDRRGSQSQVCDQNTAECLCKKNVHGRECSECVPSSFHLSDRNPDGCTTCFCSGVSNQCTSSDWRYKEVVHQNGWSQVTENEFVQDSQISDDFSILTEPKYWKLSPEYVRDIGVTAYGGKVKYDIRLWKEGSQSEMMLKSEVVLVGRNGLALTATSSNDGLSDQIFHVGLDMFEWNFLNSRGGKVTRDEFLNVLVKLRAVYLRLTTDISFGDSELKSFSVEMADTYGSGEVAKSVEQCQCPPNHQGTSCQLCAPGYYREKLGPNHGTCVKCQCNNKAQSCDSDTGECLSCRDNFVGTHCHECKKGYYLDIYSDTCKICGCPHPNEANNFASSCDVAPNGEVVNCRCLPGYSGRNCERCDVGFWGDPMRPGGRCEKCNCHSNVNELDPHSCDHKTGVCNNCLYDTTGDHCEKCKEGYYGDAILAKNCRRCECDPTGTDYCDHRTGSCVCKPNVQGNLCNQCVEGAFGFHTGRGCEMCECGIASMNNMCDLRTGQCQCRPGVTGRKCDMCQEGYWNYEPRGCQPCNCQSKGAVSCDPITGQCRCLPGVTGPNCDQCLPKWILVPDHGCKECDNCVHILLDDIDLLNHNVTQMKRELDSVSVGLQTIKRLEGINRTYHELEPRVKQLVDSPELDLSSLKDKLRTVQDLSNEVAGSSDRVERLAHFTEGDAGEAKKQANNLYDNVLKRALHEVNEAILLVQNILNTITGSVGSTNIDDILKRSEEMLAEIKRNDFGKNSMEARQEMEQATETLRRAKALMDSVNSQMNRTSEVNILIDEVLKKLQDLLSNSGRSLQHSAEVLEINLAVLHIKNDVMELVNRVESTQKDIKECLDKSEVLIRDAQLHFNDAKHALNDLELEANNFRATLKNLEDMHDKLNMENDLLKPQVEEASRHADRLNGQAHNLQSLIDNTKVSADSALRASSAYESISKAIHEALNASQQAISVAEEAVYLSSGLADSARQSRQKSDDIYSESQKISQQINDLKNKLDDIRRVLKDISEVVITEKITELVKGLENLPSEGYTHRAQEATTIAQSAQATADTAKEKINKIVEQLNDDEKRIAELPTLLHEATTNIRSAESSLNRLSSTQPEMVNLISQLTSQSEMLLKLEMELKANLNLLKNQIGVARDTAHLIKVGVNFTKDSSLQVRNIENMASAGLNSEVSLYFRTLERNGLLYYIGSDSDPNEYMILELVNGRPVFRTNLGSGDTILESPQEFNDDQWHQVRVIRNGRFISMVVLTGDQQVVEQTGQISGSEIVMNLDNAKFYVGGVPDHAIALLHGILKYTKFVGAIEGVHYDNVFIGMWNFVQAKNVRGALMREHYEGKGGVTFSGDGYLILSKGRQSDSSSSNIVFTFSTFDTDSLLFYTGNKEQENSEYILIELDNGEVKLRANLGSGEAVLVVEGKRNDGKPHEVIFKRKGNMLLFKVDGQTPKGLLKTPGLQTTFESTNEVYLGGFKGTHNVPHASNKGFKGCMSSVTIGTYEKNLLDYLEVRNVKSGCHKSSRVASFWSLHADNSYILVDDRFDASIDFSIAFKFRTNQTDALLLYLSDDKQEKATSLSVSNGKLVVTSVGDGGKKTLSSEDDVNDGKWHFVLVEKTGSDLSVNIDDTFHQSLNSGRGTSNNVFYLGGLPKDYSVTKANTASTQQFTGCIGDLSVNWRPVDFSQLSYSGTILSSCHFVDHLPFQPTVPVTIRPPVLPTRSPKAQCALPVHPEENGGGMKLGYNSWLQYNKIPNLNSVKSSYSLEFKTTEDSGVLYYVGDQNHVDFIGIYLRDGTVNVAFNCGTGVARITSRQTYNDGKWHKVQFTRMNKNGQVTIDDSESLSGTSLGSTKSIEVVAPHYVAGVERGEESKVARNLEGVIGGFVGCLRNIAHDGIDFGAADEKFGDVSECRGTTEEGTFFYKDKSRLILSRNYSVPLNFKMSFKIKPRELNAVLLSIHNVASGDYLVMQLINGEVQFSMDNGRRKDIVTVHVPVPKNRLCDGQWHTVIATKAKNVMVLQVDDVVEAPGRGEEGWAHTNTQDELYFGGVPDDSPNPGLKTRESFVGCLKDLKIDETPIRLENVESVGKIERNFCPAS